MIRGERTVLRLVTEADLDLLASWFADPELYKWWGGAQVPREVVAEKYVGRRRPRVESFVIEADRRPIGYIQFHQGFEPYHSPGEGGIDMFARHASGDAASAETPPGRSSNTYFVSAAGHE